MSSKSGAAGAIFIFESEKCHRIRPLKMATLTVNAFDAFIHIHDKSEITPVTDLYRGDIYHFTQCIDIKLIITKFSFWS